MKKKKKSSNYCKEFKSLALLLLVVLAIASANAVYAASVGNFGAGVNGNGNSPGGYDGRGGWGGGGVGSYDGPDGPPLFNLPNKTSTTSKKPSVSVSCSPSTSTRDSKRSLKVKCNGNVAGTGPYEILAITLSGDRTSIDSSGFKKSGGRFLYQRRGRSATFQVSPKKTTTYTVYCAPPHKITNQYINRAQGSSSATQSRYYSKYKKYLVKKSVTCKVAATTPTTPTDPDHPVDPDITPPTTSNPTNPTDPNDPTIDDTDINDPDITTTVTSDPTDDPDTDPLVRPPIFTPAPTATITASPTLLRSGQVSTITWSSTDTSNCSVYGPDLFSTALFGSQDVTISQDSIYTISCNGGARDSVRVRVIPNWNER